MDPAAQSASEAMKIWLLVSPLITGVVGALIALGGVWLQNNAAERRFNSQLAHDAKQKEKDRLKDLRKDVYLRAAQELTRAAQYIITIPNLDPTKLQFAIAPLVEALAQLQLVSSEDTALLSIKVSIAFAELHQAVLLSAHDLHDSHIDLQIGEDQQKRVEAEVFRLQHAIKALNESGSVPPNQWQILQGSLARQQQRWAEVAASNQATRDRRDDQQLEFLSDHFLNDVEAFSKVSLPLTIALRHEFDVGGKFEAFDAEQTEAARRTRAMIGRMVTEMRSRVEARRNQRS